MNGRRKALLAGRTRCAIAVMGSANFGFINVFAVQEVLPYFKRLETVEPSLRDDRYRGNSGPVHIKNNIGPNYLFTKFTETWLRAAQERGHRVGDHNGQEQVVFAPMQVNVNRNGRRDSTDNAYIK